MAIRMKVRLGVLIIFLILLLQRITCMSNSNGSVSPTAPLINSTQQRTKAPMSTSGPTPTFYQIIHYPTETHEPTKNPTSLPTKAPETTKTPTPTPTPTKLTVIIYKPTTIYNSSIPPKSVNGTLKTPTPTSTKVTVITNDPTTIFFSNIIHPTKAASFVLKAPTPIPTNVATIIPKRQPMTSGQKKEPTSFLSIAAATCIVIIIISSTIILIIAFFPFRLLRKGTEDAMKDDDTTSHEIENPPSVVIFKTFDEVSSVGQFTANPLWTTYN